MADFTIRKADSTWVVRVAGAIIGETRQALVLEENGYAPVVYFPRDAFEMALLEPSDKTTTCPDKGEASYFGVSTPEGVIADLAWSYEAPLEKAARIAGYLAFDGERATVERL